MLYQKQNKNNRGQNLSASLNKTMGQMIEEIRYHFGDLHLLCGFLGKPAPVNTYREVVRTWRHDQAHCNLVPSRCQHLPFSRISVRRTEIIKPLCPLLQCKKSSTLHLFSFYPSKHAEAWHEQLLIHFHRFAHG